ncbi:uncharacterized protein PITG_19312 [Phytophthora infestans T30-4]|uniref:Uncharacterized protein n=1 Tax=Phytophthora infestans (strain T30-4) TaxID=403677 RepID=D0NZX6_PHYIT|nr:uncharacterized protein PITG_19312 [Phytophthora infestans T30-4]EEY69692.1 conserved hypothetical protein [Phytophthora infestans T30-4]|eukprot:XP_002997104.1 conserved hypothetical protein [Phytophthora infestans T30-4]
MAPRNTRYWRSFLHNLLCPPDVSSSETSYDGVCFFTLSGRVEYRDGCFQASLTPALRLSGCVFHIVSATFSSIRAVASGKYCGLIVEKLPFGVLVVGFSSPLRLEAIFGRIHHACTALRR